MILRPVTETDPKTGRTHTRFVEERIDDPFGPGGTRPVAIPEGERAAIDLAQQLRRTENEREREELHDRLRAALSEAFDQRRERQRREIEELERQLDSLRRLDAERQERKDDIVRRRMKQLLGEPDVLDWEPPSRDDLAFPFEAPRVPETSSPRSFDTPGQWWNAPDQPPRPEPGFVPGSPARPDRPSPRGEAGRPAPAPMDDPFGPWPGSAPNDDAPRTTDRRPGPDRRPGGEDETQPEPRRSRGTLRAENIEIEWPDGPRRQRSGTSSFRAASAERVLDLTEKIARAEADTRRQAALIRNRSGAENEERFLESRRGEIVGLQARLRLARLEWELVGRLLTDELNLAQESLRNAAGRLERMQKLFAFGDLPSSELAEPTSELTRAKADAASAERRVRAWKEMDQILRQRIALLTDAHDEANDARDREDEATGNTPHLTDLEDLDADVDKRTIEEPNSKPRSNPEARKDQPDEARESEQQPERESETGDGTGTEDADGDGDAEEASDDAEATPDGTERDDRKSGDEDGDTPDRDRDEAGDPQP